MSQLDTLISQRIAANRAYRAGQPFMSDSDFDQLDSILRAQLPESHYAFKHEDSFSSEFQKDAPLTIHMGSQNKALTATALMKESFVLQHELHASLKIDGQSIEVTYIDRAYTRAITRGDDGVIGKDVSAVLDLVSSVPRTLPEHSPVNCVVRGELYLTKSGLDSINAILIKEGSEPFANTRNSVSSITRTLKHIRFAQYLSFMAFDIQEVA